MEKLKSINAVGNEEVVTREKDKPYTFVSNHEVEGHL